MELRENDDEDNNESGTSLLLEERISNFCKQLSSLREAELGFGPVLYQSVFWAQPNVEIDAEVPDDDEDMEEDPDPEEEGALYRLIDSLTPSQRIVISKKINVLRLVMDLFTPSDHNDENHSENACKADDNNQDNFTTMLCSLTEVDKHNIVKQIEFSKRITSIFLALADLFGLKGSDPFPLLVLENLPDQISSEEGKCIICFREISVGEILKKLPCGHIFDKNCIILWLREKNICPLCREELEFSFEETKRITCAIFEEVVTLLNEFNEPVDPPSDS